MGSNVENFRTSEKFRRNIFKMDKKFKMIRITEKDVCEKKKIFNFVQRSSGPP